MIDKRYPTWLEFAVVAYCVWQAWDLEWASTPAVRRGGLAFALWCIPIGWNQSQAIRHDRAKGYTAFLLCAGVLFALLGSMGSLRVLTHLGLACALAGTIPFTWPMVIWLASAIAWMPAFGWLLRALSIPIIQLLQFTCVLLGTGIMLWTWREE